MGSEKLSRLSQLCFSGNQFIGEDPSAFEDLTRELDRRQLPLFEAVGVEATVSYINFLIEKCMCLPLGAQEDRKSYELKISSLINGMLEKNTAEVALGVEATVSYINFLIETLRCLPRFGAQEDRKSYELKISSLINHMLEKNTAIFVRSILTNNPIKISQEILLGIDMQRKLDNFDRVLIEIEKILPNLNVSEVNLSNFLAIAPYSSIYGGSISPVTVLNGDYPEELMLAERSTPLGSFYRHTYYTIDLAICEAEEIQVTNMYFVPKTKI